MFPKRPLRVVFLISARVRSAAINHLVSPYSPFVNTAAMTTASSVFPYLRSCKQEVEKPIEGTTTGEIPRWLKGCLIRIGSGLLEVGPDRYCHVFDGLALMHRFSFQDGQVTYQNRFLRSDAYRDNMRANRIVVSEFGTRAAPDPCKTIFQRFSSLFSMDMTDNDLVNIVLYGNEAFACSETNNIWKIDIDSLESLQKVNLKDYLPTDGAIAHAHEDPDGTVYNVGTSYGLFSHYNIIKFPPKEDGRSPFEAGRVVCRIPASKFLRPSYYHSFATTDRYIVLVEQPLYLSMTRMAWAHFVSGAYSQAMQWDPNSMSRFHVVRRSDGQLLDTPYLAPPFFVFHHINAFEESGHLVVDLCGYEKGDIVNSLYVKAIEEAFNQDIPVKDMPFVSRARRYVLPLLTKGQEQKGVNLVTLPDCKATAVLEADGTVFCDFEFLTGKDAWAPELPRINYQHFNGKKYKYFYAMARNDDVDGVHLIKVNTETKTTVSWCEKGAVPSEPVFLPQPDLIQPEEDSGVVVASLLYQSDERRVSLLVLNAKTMAEVGRVTFRTRSAVPSDFHGTFVTTSR